MIAFNLLLAFLFVGVMFHLAGIFRPSDTIASSWANAGQMILTLATVPLVGLFLLYGRVQARLREPPPEYWRYFTTSSVEVTLGIVALSLVVSIVMLAKYHVEAPTQSVVVHEAVVADSGNAATAVAFAAIYLVAMLGAFVALTIAWDNCRRWRPDEAGCCVDVEIPTVDPQLPRKPTRIPSRTMRDVLMLGVGALGMVAIAISRRRSRLRR